MRATLFCLGEKWMKPSQIFELNTKYFPDSWNVWDSLAEAYAKAGKKDCSCAVLRKNRFKWILRAKVAKSACWSAEKVAIIKYWTPPDAHRTALIPTSHQIKRAALFRTALPVFIYLTRCYKPNAILIASSILTKRPGPAILKSLLSSNGGCARNRVSCSMIQLCRVYQKRMAEVYGARISGCIYFFPCREIGQSHRQFHKRQSSLTKWV